MSLQDLLEVVPAGTGEEDLLARDRLRAAAAPRRGDHGRQRPLGAAAAEAPRRGPPRGDRRPCATWSRPSARLGLEVLTLYAFSIENWKRPKTEVATLMGLLKHYLRSELDTLLRNNIRFRCRPRPRSSSPTCSSELARGRCSAPRRKRACSSTSRSTTAAAPRSRTPCGGSSPRWRRAGRARSSSTSAPSRAHLYTAGQPDPDLLIRTSGELRVSNFLLWQIAYAEIWVTDVLWPDFGAATCCRRSWTSRSVSGATAESAPA